MRVWYHVKDIDAGRAFYTQQLGFSETYHDEEGRWSRLIRDGMEIALAEGPLQDGGTAMVDVEDVKGEAERLRGLGVQVGVVVELHGQMRILDVFDPDGNRLQLAQELESAS
jgi:catechol 2,3-dioxygenase-like lactoylglutathione lyase family enzyme